MPEQIEEVELSANGGELHLPQVIVDLFGGSRSEARRKLQQGGVKLDGEPMPADPLDVPAASLDGRVHAAGQAPVPPNQNFFGETLVGREAAATLLHRGWGKQARPEPSGLCSGPRVR